MNKDKKGVIAVIPARAGSRGVKDKNIKEFAGKPLIYWALSAANDSPIIEKVIVPTDSKKIRKIVEDFSFKKTKVIGRSREGSLGTSPSEMVLMETAKKYRFKDIVFLQATNPFIKASDIDNAYKYYKKEKFDSLFTGVEQKRFIWARSKSRANALNYDYNKRPRRQDFKPFLVENGAFYITSKENLFKHKNRLSGKVGAYPMKPYSYFELDEANDWPIAEALFMKNYLYLNEKINLNKIKVLALDVDGVFTDGGVYYTQNGEKMLKFSRVDGKGIMLFREAGGSILILSAENSQIVKRRLEKLKIKDYHLGTHEKYKDLKKYLAKKGVGLNETAFIGDDVQDIEIMEKVGFSACPANAVERVKKYADYICKNKGGNGAIREVIEKILGGE